MTKDPQAFLRLLKKELDGLRIDAELDKLRDARGRYGDDEPGWYDLAAHHARVKVLRDQNTDRTQNEGKSLGT